MAVWAIPRALGGETASNVELRLARKDTGETWWGSYNFSPVQDETGKISEPSSRPVKSAH